MQVFFKYLVISFINSALLIFIAKIVLDKCLRRNVDFYEKDERKYEAEMLSKVKVVNVTDEER